MLLLAYHFNLRLSTWSFGPNGVRFLLIWQVRCAFSLPGYPLSPNTRFFCNLSNVNFSSSAHEPLSGFSLALVVHNHITLLLRDPTHHAFSFSKAHLPQTPNFLLLKRHHILADKVYTTNATSAGQTRQIRIDCSSRDHSSLRFSVDGDLVLQIKRLKFRGNKRVLIHGVNVHISWDLYNWLFPKDNNQTHAIFMFKFHQDSQAISDNSNTNHNSNLVNLWTLGVYEWGKVGKSCSSSSVSLASSVGSFGASFSVLEWSSFEENELVVPLGFSLIVYAGKR